MKKSKFLKSSKDILSRSFNPSKCKISLRLAASRLKLLRNKKEVQVKQMRREISLLLESGQDQTARIRVEHVIREEKMMAAFDLIEIYCELIVARLPIIESQKICPIDLKEAITSVVFASPRCGDVPELVDVRKHFTDKYGKDFITAAIELRPDCGVSRMLTEKLSAVAPDLPTKIKVLSAIAEEHNVVWDAKPLEQNSVAASDLLTGPSTFVKESERLVEPSRFQGPDTTVPQTNQVDHRTSLGTERLISPQVSGVSTALQRETRPQALGGERAQLYHEYSNISPRDRQRWPMEFTDATSAAQAAAESAEMASMAARAAAELSSRGMVTRQYSTESHKSDDHSFRDGAPETYMRSKFVSEQFSKDSTNRSFSEHGRLQNENTGGRYEAGRDGRKEYSHSSSLKSKASIDDDSMDHRDVSAVDRYSRKNSLNEVPRGEKSMQRQSFKYQAENRQEKSENVREETVRNQESFTSHSHSSISNNVNIFSNPEEKKIEYEEAYRTSSRGSAVVFDRSDSDTENDGFDIRPTYDEPEQGFQLPLSSQKSRERLPPNTNSWSPTSSSSKNVKSSASVLLTRKSSKLDDSMSVTFDESEGRTSESEEDMKISRDSRNSRDFASEQKKQSFGSLHNEFPQFEQTQLSLSSDYESEETDSERNRRKRFDADSPAKFNLRKPSADQPALVPKKNQTELNNVDNSSPEKEEGLNFGKLTGGFRHKGYNYPSLGKNQFDVSPSKKESNTFSVESPRNRTMLERKNTKPDLQSISDTDSSEEEEDSMQKSYDHKHQLYTRRSGKDLKTKPSFTASNSMFGSEHSDSDEDLPKKPLSRRTSRLQSGISRRTKASPSDYEKEKLSKLQLSSEALDVDDGMDRKATTSTRSEPPKQYETKRNSSKLGNYEQHTLTKAQENSNSKVELRSEAHDSHVRKEQKPTKSQEQFQTLKGNSSQWRNSDLPSSSKVATTKPSTSNSHGYLHPRSSEKANSLMTGESKVSSRPSAVEEASIPQRKSEPSIIQENLKAETLSKTSSNKDSSNQKASHVHPKLPDYDSFIQIFQKNRP